MSLLTEQSLRRNGTVKSRYFIIPTLTFLHNFKEVSVALTHRRKSTPPYTRVCATLNLVNDCDIIVAKETISYKIGKAFGYGEIKIGDDAFDGDFFIRSKNEIVVRNILTDKVKAALDNIKDLKPALKIAKNKFSFVVPCSPKDTYQLDQIIDTGLLILSQLKDASYIM
ncbi:MAG: hypothetical protein P9X22_08555 [Candidatus Zapsychrus exili]|nr:hypothetical protein [Candidatus Zapsychrus exili]